MKKKKRLSIPEEQEMMLNSYRTDHIQELEDMVKDLDLNYELKWEEGIKSEIIDETFEIINRNGIKREE